MVDRKSMEMDTKEASLEKDVAASNSAGQTKSDVKGVATAQHSSFHEKAEKGKDIKIVKGLVGDKMGTPASPLELFARKCTGKEEEVEFAMHPKPMS
jgi:hypothetical protein